MTASKYFLLFKNSCVLSWPGKVTFIIWIVGFFVLLSLTVKDFVPLLDDYVNNNVATQMKIETKQIPPNITICLPNYITIYFEVFDKVANLDDGYLNGSKSMRGVCDACDQLKNHSLDFWNYLLRKENNNNYYYKGANAKWFAQQVLRGHFKNFTWDSDEVNSVWFQTVVDMIMVYFKLIYIIDLESVMSEEDKNLADHLDNNFTNQEIDELFDFVRKAFEVSIKGGCTILPDTSAIPNSTTRSPLKLDSFTIINNKFCFSMPIDFGNQDFVCSYNRWPYNWNRYMDSVLEVHPSPSVLFWPFNDQNRNPLYLSQKPLYTTNGSIFDGVNVSEHIYLSYNVDTKLIVNDPDCSNERYSEVCVAGLQVVAAIDHCGCVPFTFRKFRLGEQYNYPYCSTKHYNASCQQEFRLSFDRAQDKCVKKCEYTHDTWAPAKTKIAYEKYNNEYPQILVAFKVSKIPFTEFSLINKTSQAQFISSVGGLLNLYIGGSGLTIVALVLLCIEQCKLWWRTKARDTTPEQQTDATSGWMVLRMVTMFRMIGMNNHQPKTDNGTQEIENLAKQNENVTKQIGVLTKQIDVLTKQNEEMTHQNAYMTKEFENMKNDLANILRQQATKKKK